MDPKQVEKWGWHMMQEVVECVNNFRASVGLHLLTAKEVGRDFIHLNWRSFSVGKSGQFYWTIGGRLNIGDPS
jgi:hypothetical protein